MLLHAIPPTWDMETRLDLDNLLLRLHLGIVVDKLLLGLVDAFEDLWDLPQQRLLRPDDSRDHRIESICWMETRQHPPRDGRPVAI
jgi:hypothetical protein